ncbi:hypothetical protein DFA_08223 [Cavenderia fasciculata]|uniref:Uncharacterized protein n=1 Tax=Cavenderia fasciculata TaxID=261658 RepID=F4Q5H4_CACFS|nr:uncharacterized protein DFA_08223 [Cavenderia fasciculata]EGG17233.1 hypothetical protein DFA_08223 [Cavenderia fasciculata]|eukprot:XP_004355717.1 hypothetical protein DFA_08223 [Cavenderia fasciculata]
MNKLTIFMLVALVAMLFVSVSVATVDETNDRCDDCFNLAIANYNQCKAGGHSFSTCYDLYRSYVQACRNQGCN